MDRETSDLIARQYLSEKNLSQVEPREYAEWAAFQLEKEQDTPMLRSLAKMQTTDNLAEVESQFRECISELGWEMPGKKSALKQYSRSIMQSIVEGSTKPYDGCSQLYVNSIFLGHPKYLYNWNFLFWSMEDLEPEELDSLIMEEAIRALGVDPATRSDEAASRGADVDQSESIWTRFKNLLGF